MEDADADEVTALQLATVPNVKAAVRAAQGRRGRGRPVAAALDRRRRAPRSFPATTRARSRRRRTSAIEAAARLLLEDADAPPPPPPLPPSDLKPTTELDLAALGRAPAAAAGRPPKERWRSCGRRRARAPSSAVHW